ncbi:MAG: hypothetical protein AAGL29_09805 [Bacteroidota bacterium]
MMDQSRYHPENKLIQFFKKHGKERLAKPSECVIDIGERCDRAFLILEGGFVCQNYSAEADRLKTINFHLKTFHPIMTVIHSFYSEASSDCQLKAIMRSKVLSVQKRAIEREMEKDKSLRETYVQETIYALLAINEFHTKLITLNTKAMYHYLTISHGEIVQKIPAKYIAEFMGVSAEWLSRIR